MNRITILVETTDADGKFQDDFSGIVYSDGKEVPALTEPQAIAVVKELVVTIGTVTPW